MRERVARVRSASTPASAGQLPVVDGRTALGAALACILVTVLTPDGHPLRLAGEALLVVGALAALRTPVRWLLPRLGLLLPFLLLTAASVPFMRPGDGSHSSLERAAMTLSRALICFGALAAALRAAEVQELLHAIGRLRVPPIFVTLTALMLRYLGVLEGEAARMLRARDARGVPPTIRERARVAGSMVGTLFVRSFERSERVSLAMQARGFTGLLPPPVAHPVPARDLLALAGFLLVQVLLMLVG